MVNQNPEQVARDKIRSRIYGMPPLNPDCTPARELGLRDCQERAIVNLEQSLKENRPRALIQMATGAGKTFTAITSIYRLLKFTKARRVLFLVDTQNLREQAEQEFMAYVPTDDNRKFTELYNVQCLRSSAVAMPARWNTPSTACSPQSPRSINSWQQFVYSE